MKTLRNLLLPVLVGLSLLVVVGLVGTVSMSLREAFALHPAAGWAAVAAVAAGVFLLVGYPLVRVARLPRSLRRPSEESGPQWDRFVERYADRLLENRRLRSDYDQIEVLRSARRQGGRALEEQVEAATRHLDLAARSVLVRHAAAVFTTTAVSQSGRLDTIIVLSAQLRMVKEIAELYWQRPSLRELTRLYANVGATAFLAGEIEDSEILAVLGAPVTAGITGLVPVGGTDPLVSLLVNSLLDGSTNAFLTLRVGVLARRHCGLHLVEDRRALARSASVEGAGLLAGVVASGARRIATITRRAVAESATRGPRRAARGVADFGTSVVGSISGLAGRATEKAFRIGPKGKELGQRGLAETVEFWEQIAGVFRAEAAPGTLEPVPPEPGERN